MSNIPLNTPQPLAPWLQAQQTDLLRQRGHAWLVHGPSGLGQYALGLALVRAWLCDAATVHGACGHCASCHAIDVHAHADLCVLMPETVMMALGWPLSEKAQADIDDKKRKASKEIRVEAMRDAVVFSQRTSARSRGKAVLVYPAEQMNNITANALLKTLEEPPGDVKFVLACEAAHELLPTIRSRCLGHAMQWPAPDAALAWLSASGVDALDAAVWLRAAGGRPDDALALARSGAAATSWSELPRAVARGDLSKLEGWGMAQVLETLQKICHDALVSKVGGQPRFFEAKDLQHLATAAISVPRLSAWAKSLAQAARTVDHPFNAGLMLEALGSQARAVLHN
jgi:DNA polymerase-3 subunit delta'